MKKKVLLVTLLVVAIVASCFAFTACNKDKGDGDKGVKVAMITDYGDITDQSFNQTTYEACKAYCDANNIKFKYYKPTGDSTEARVASVNAAIAEGYTIIVMPGYAFGGTIVEVADNNPELNLLLWTLQEAICLKQSMVKNMIIIPIIRSGLINFLRT